MPDYVLYIVVAALGVFLIGYVIHDTIKSSDYKELEKKSQANWELYCKEELRVKELELYVYKIRIIRYELEGKQLVEIAHHRLKDISYKDALEVADGWCEADPFGHNLVEIYIPNDEHNRWIEITRDRLKELAEKEETNVV